MLQHFLFKPAFPEEIIYCVLCERCFRDFTKPKMFRASRIIFQSNPRNSNFCYLSWKSSYFMHILSVQVLLCCISSDACLREVTWTHVILITMMPRCTINTSTLSCGYISHMLTQQLISLSAFLCLMLVSSICCCWIQLLLMCLSFYLSPSVSFCSDSLTLCINVLIVL